MLLAQNGVVDVDGVPILDSLAAWVKQAETMHDLRTLCGIKTCRRGYYHKPPEPERVREVFSFYGLDRLQSSS
ncbi:hypothetical protein D9M71_744470 [compost metagenome]